MATKLQKAQAEVTRLWEAMCIEEGVSVNEKFVVFNSTNSQSKAYNAAVKKFFRLKSNAAPAKLALLYSPAQWKAAVRPPANRVLFVDAVMHAAVSGVIESTYDKLPAAVKKEFSFKTFERNLLAVE